MPGTVFVGFGFLALKSAAHCIDGPSAHMAGSPMTFGFPGMQVKSLVPSRRTMVLPCASVSMILADAATSAGPADMARAILASVVSAALIEELCVGVFGFAAVREIKSNLRENGILGNFKTLARTGRGELSHSKFARRGGRVLRFFRLRLFGRRVPGIW